MRTSLLVIPAFALAVICQPAHAEPPSDYRMSSLMPLPQVAQYPSTTTPTAQPVSSRPSASSPGAGFYSTQYGGPAATPTYSAYPPRPATGQAYPSYPMDSWSTGSYRHVSTPSGTDYFRYANGGDPRPPQPTMAAPPMQSHVPPPAPQAAPYSAQPDPYMDAMSGNWGTCDGYGGGYGGGYGYGYGVGHGIGACGPFCPHWSVDVAGLFMGRLDNNPEYFSWEWGNERDQLCNGIQNWAAGFQVGLTRRFCCGYNTYAFQASYWGLFPNRWDCDLRDPTLGGNIFSVYDFDPLVVYDAGGPATVAVNWFFDNAVRHYVQRSWEVHNIEFNLLGGSLLGDGVAGWGMGGTGYCGGGACGMGGCGAACAPAVCGGPRLNLGWLFGVRFMYFGDDLQFASDRDNYTFDYDDWEMYYDIDVENHLIGLQLGFGSDWAITPRLHVRAGTKFGVFGNHINHASQIYGSMGTAFVSGGPNAGMEYNVNSSETAVTFLGELDLGMAYQISKRITAGVGYRIVAVSGVAVADGQIPRNFAGIQDVEDIDSKDDLVLHGGYAKLEFCW